jgi:predicted Zn-dependent protease/O-antigen ligase
MACCVAVAIQLVPLPPFLLRWLAPASHDVFEGVLGPVGLYPTWRPLTLDIPATARELAKLVGWLCIFSVLQDGAMRSRSARRRILIYIVGAGTVVAAIGFGHMAVGAERLFGVHEYLRRPRLLTTFGNGNHLAACLEVTALLALGAALGEPHLRRRLTWAACFMVSALGALWNSSRGGLVSLLVGLIALMVLGRHATQPDPKPQGRKLSPKVLLGIAMGLTFAAGAWLFATAPEVRREILAMAQVSSSTEHDKIQAVQTGIAAFAAQPITGIGRGAFESAHARFLPGPAGFSYTHVENEPLQAVAELGLAGGLALIGVLAAAWWGLSRRARTSWLEAGAAAAAVAIALHNLLDFSLQYAGGLTLLALLTYRSVTPRAERVAKLAPSAIAWALALALVALASVRAWPGLAVDSHQLTQLAGTPEVALADFEQRASAALALRPADPLACELAARKALETSATAKALPWLNRAMLQSPFSPRPHLAAGDALLKLGRRTQALTEWRLAAEYGIATVDRVLRHARSLDEVTAAMPLAPQPASTAIDLLLAEGKLEAAIAAAEQALAEHPGNPKLIDLLSRSYSRDGRLAELDRLALQLQRELPDQPNGWLIQASVLATSKQVDRARGVLRAGLEQLPNNPLLLLAGAELELRAGQAKAASKALEKLEPSIPPEARFKFHLLRADAYLNLGEGEKSRSELRRALRLHPEDPVVRVRLARQYLTAGRLDEAESLVAQLPSDHPDAQPLLQELARKRQARKPALR